MDQGKFGETEQSFIDSKCQKIIPEVEKSSVLSTGLDKSLANPVHKKLDTPLKIQTPVKTNVPFHTNPDEDSVKLTKKCKIIAQLFDRMVCSLRLLNLSKKLPTYQNIRAQVEVLERREFSYRHLAQIIYILPEAIQIDKILIHDKKTLCMKPDMKVTLRLDVVENHHEWSPFIALRHLFSSRLSSFFVTQPEGTDIPEAILPEPFNHMNPNNIPEAIPGSSSTESFLPFVETEPVHASHTCQSLTRKFSHKCIDTETEKTQLIEFPVTLLSVGSDATFNDDVDNQIRKEMHVPLSKSTVISFPYELIQHDSLSRSDVQESPVRTLPSSDKCVMVDTPAQFTPNRYVPSCKIKMTDSLNQVISSAVRSINFSICDGDENVSNVNVNEIDCELISNTMSQNSGDGNIKNSKGWTIKDNGKNQVDEVAQQMSGLLSVLVPVISHIFQSSKGPSITKEELVHKIIMHDCDIVDRHEVEERIGLLEKLVPDWIFGKSTSSGDILYTIKAVSDLDSIRARLLA